MKKHYVVFDGTSSFVIPSNEFDPEFMEILLQTNDFNEACNYADKYNEEIFNENN